MLFNANERFDAYPTQQPVIVAGKMHGDDDNAPGVNIGSVPLTDN